MPNQGENPMVNDEEPQADESDEKYCVMEERLGAIEGNDAYGLDAFDTCLVLDVVIPPKFKVPDFKKYKGVRYAKTHTRVYFQKWLRILAMVSLFIHYFPESNSEASLEWYM